MDQLDDNVMDTSLESYGDSGDVMDISSVSYRNPNDVNSPVAHQNTDDPMDNPYVTDQEADDIVAAPPVAHQNPDTMMDNPPVKHDEKYTENFNYDNDDIDVTDSTTKVEFQMQPTSVPFTSLDQDLGVNTPGTSNKACEEYKDNVKPVEGGSETKPNGNANIDYMDSDLTVALFGSSDAVQFGCDNILLGEKQLCLSAGFPMIIPLERKISEHHVSVINMIGSHEIDHEPQDHVIGQLVNENEIHAFIFVVRLGQLTDADKMSIEWLQRIFGDRVLSFVMIVFTYEQEEECDTTIDDLKNNSVLEQLLKKCEGRYHTSSKIMNKQSELTALVDRIKQLFTDNNQRCYTREMYSSPRDLQNSAEKEVSIGDTIAQPLGSLVLTDKGEIEKMCAKQLIDRIHLEGKHQKLRTVDFLKPIVQSQESCAEEELVSVFLQKLMMMDYRARCLKIKENSEQHHARQRNNDSSEDVGDAFYNIFGKATKLSEDTNKLDAVHLMDVQMAVFHCAHSFLKQLMVTKLSQCQYALPLLVPNPFTQEIEFPLWTFRQINKSWKTIDNTGQISSKFQPVYKAKTPMVAFFRFGPVTSSKSQLMNSLINEKHNTFFHRNCPGSSRTRVLMDGVVEIAWYCPSGETTDRFTHCVAFCNLHGDAGAHETQLSILTKMASVNVAILPQLDKNDKSMTRIQNFYSDSKPLICLLSDSDSALTEMREGKYKIGLKDRNQSVVFEEIRSAINNGLLSTESCSFFKLEDMAKLSSIRVDEVTDEDCWKGKEAALRMMSLLKDKDLTEIKESFMPCQGKLWHQWCQKNKELYRPTLGELHKESNIEKNKSSKKSKMLKIRELQQTSDISQFILIFIQKLNSQARKEVVYFLKWLGILLDDYTSECLSALHHQYDEKWSTVLNLKKKHDRSQQMTAAQVELERVSEKLQAATFGLEHILREIGQIYESCSSVKKNKKDLLFNFTSLPGLAAEMMISGFPLELMDGDAAHVPLIWVTAVLDALIQKLGEKRVYVLSVLGIQSSGKSTMLNAMFGLQFAVSAGRCTRGAFMQLVRVSEEMKTKLKFDYILVVDTEGLRALELAGRSTRNHDNEMATFVVGLGNMTLINIFGENPVEIQDILQIVVQAFMRMKKVKLSPSCMFVHQNVSDVTAGEKNMEGRRRLQEKLDEMTKLAAKEEDCDTEFFSDVIAFDIQNDVKYFAQLWEGSPPMAPPNPDYSKNIQELKETILSKASNSSGITMSQFRMRINDLWNALLNENFVFSFKNTLEIATYRRLETKYSDWTWSLRSAMLSVEDKFYNRIDNGNIKVHDHELLTEMKNTKDQVEKAMLSYFEEDKDKEILCQWRGRFETRIKELHEDLVKGTKRKLDEATEQKKAREKVDKKRTEYENKLFNRSKELALSLRNTGMDEHMLNGEFDTMWSKWVTEMTEDCPPLKDFNFWDDVMKILSEHYEFTLVNERLNQTNFKPIDYQSGYCDYITLKHLKNSNDTVSSEEAGKNSKKSKKEVLKQIMMFPAQILMSGIEYVKGTQKQPENMDVHADCPYTIMELIDKITEKTEMIMDKALVGKSGYNASYIQEIIECVKKSVKQHESLSKKYKLKKEFTIDLILYLCDIARQTFTELHKEFIEANDPRIYFGKQKSQYWNMFKNFYKGAATTTNILSEFICSKLEPSILQAVYNKTAIDLAARMRSEIQALRENRPNLEKHILKSLAEKEDFGQYIEYIHNPRRHFKQFIKNEVDRYYTEQNSMILNIFKGNLREKQQIVSNAVKAATGEVKSQSGDGNMWFRCFTTALTDELKLTENSCGDLSEIKDLDFLDEVLGDSLKEKMTNLHDSFTSINNIKIKMCRKTPDEILIDHFCQCCWVQCPFCKAICTNTMKGHPGDHCVPFHRNDGLNGWHFRGTTNLAVDFCTTLVASDTFFHPNSSGYVVPYKKYRKGGRKYAKWSITPDHTELPYWKWFVCRFQEDLEMYYSKKFQGGGEIPYEWRRYTKKEALESLDKYM
ncbi:interferon-induced very large GTPase 1-like [Garra rufa]|uniref:interferon-induced very large GTPase 1-like n=1 Tax=Garra rufa TaxID=137080 RepID=UPI003CCEA632